MLRLLLFIGSTIASVPRLACAVDFAHEVAPILKARCAACHTNGVYKGGANFDTRETLLRSKVATPGNSAESDLIARIMSTDPDERMPPTGERLTAAQVAVLKRWVDEGLKWEPSFTFGQTGQQQPLKLQPVKLPKAQPGREHPVDRLVDAYLAKQRVPQPKTIDDAAFLRRVSLDLVGLLPTLTDQSTFSADSSLDKRARLVDQLLNDTPAARRDYAEHWLTFWNDLLRNDYAGTGFIDGGRKPITDWLYKSLLENRPYDQFVRELIAPTSDSEGFIKGIKWRGRVNASQVPEIQFAQNVSQVFLGINMKCASCHDSFIDVWKLSDAYGLAAIVAEKPLTLHRCDISTGETAQAKFLWPELGTLDPQLPREQRLTRLAELLTQPANGRLARTVVNRLWQRLFGRGIVHPVDVMANPPWNHDLLEFLALELVEHKYDLKHVLRLIVTSQAYQAASVPPEDVDSDDYVYRGPLARRLTAEQYLDAIYTITETTPTKSAVATGERGKAPLRAALLVSDPLMRSLGRPNREQVVTTRPEELSTLQALDLNNGQVMNELVARGGKTLQQRFAQQGSDQLIDYVYRAALGRAATDNERQVGKSLVGDPLSVEGTADLLWIVFMLPEFQINR